jgi:ribosome-associated protein
VTDPATPSPAAKKPAAAARPAAVAKSAAVAKKPATAVAAKPATAAKKPATAAKKPASAAKKPTLGLPAREAPVPAGDRAFLDIARRVVELAEDKKAADIVLLDIGELTTLADAFVICSGGSERQLDAIADAIVEGLRAEGVRPIGREGVAASHWVLLDFGGVVVHIFTPPERDFYQLEKHWSEARTVVRVQ